ncbi:tryptophan synthase beta subunit-like PLP-dependent enzyme [Podospora aff. communis PSN243]|uniref:Tryptophan synthase beta subunit-like PLP-dependent enzyme n=1 Tax=Podospora aff. communis PSN243 TaxID=3040156 RepID=A0AAV9GRR7_9PEZI|nr:tryptophan synthase beta subunit-like PLP-dependent enzyme [Podospora aff. communis PSN243]
MPSAIYINPPARTWRFVARQPSSFNASPTRLTPHDFHRQLPFYNLAPLHSLPAVAASLGLSHVLVKDESSRFGLPAFKILGASWAFYRAVCEHLGVDFNRTEFLKSGVLGEVVRERGMNGLKVLTTTEGNWGRAMAKMGAYFGVDTVVYVPEHMVEETRELIREEGAEVVVVDGDYDYAVAAVMKRAENDDRSLMVMDISFEGYEDVQKWVVEGYQTMLDESDEQVTLATGGKFATHTIVPVGCGSIAQGVVQHCKSEERERNGTATGAVIAVEPITAACLKASLENGKATSVKTGISIMCGMNCGTLSTAAWPILQAGVDASIVVGESEAHHAVLGLDELAVKAGPCGASTLAALRIACTAAKAKLRLDEHSVVVLNCTEGPRGYIIPT